MVLFRYEERDLSFDRIANRQLLHRDPFQIEVAPRRARNDLAPLALDTYSPIGKRTSLFHWEKAGVEGRVVSTALPLRFICCTARIANNQLAYNSHVVRGLSVICYWADLLVVGLRRLLRAPTTKDRSGYAKAAFCRRLSGCDYYFAQSPVVRRLSKFSKKTGSTGVPSVFNGSARNWSGAIPPSVGSSITGQMA